MKLFLRYRCGMNPFSPSPLLPFPRSSFSPPPFCSTTPRAAYDRDASFEGDTTAARRPDVTRTTNTTRPLSRASCGLELFLWRRSGQRMSQTRNASLAALKIRSSRLNFWFCCCSFARRSSAGPKQVNASYAQHAPAHPHSVRKVRRSIYRKFDLDSSAKRQT